MNFYHVYYKRQYRNGDKGVWEDTFYNHQGIVVIANDYNEAKSKIEKCLAKVEDGNHRAVLTNDIVKCIGLDIRHGFEWSLEVNPIFDTMSVECNHEWEKN